MKVLFFKDSSFGPRFFSEVFGFGLSLFFSSGAVVMRTSTGLPGIFFFAKYLWPFFLPVYRSPCFGVCVPGSARIQEVSQCSLALPGALQAKVAPAHFLPALTASFSEDSGLPPIFLAFFRHDLTFFLT